MPEASRPTSNWAGSVRGAIERLGDLGERQRAVGADDVERTVLELDVAGRGFQHHRRHRLGLLDDGVGGALERVAADMIEREP